jgi:hypothetical protein
MLNTGNYMLVSKVKEFIGTHFKSCTESLNPLPTHSGELGEYYDTDDIKGAIPKDVFQEMECDCVTYMIFQK